MTSAQQSHGMSGYKAGCRCDVCCADRRAYDRERYQRLREKRLQQVKEYREANPEKMRAWSKAQYHRDPELARQRAAASLAKNPATRKAAQARYQQSDKGRLKNLRATHKRRGAVTDEWTNEYIALLIGDLCSYCSGPGGTVDHIVPVSKGGTSEWDNLTAACLTCNSSKRDFDLLDFLSRKAS